MSIKRPRLIIAAASSGCGKTTITMGLIKAFTSRGISVYPFKIGPDYIDPGFHSICAEKPCYNLDSVLMEKDKILECLAKHSTPEGLAVIEGVMGLYDGKTEGFSTGSTAEVAKLTDSPVIVIIDAKAAAQTVGAIALGIKLFDPDCPVAGFILNKLGSRKHFDIVKKAVEDATELPVLGWMPKSGEIIFPERHLGLVAAWEYKDQKDPAHPAIMAKTIYSVMKDYFDFDSISKLGKSASDLNIDEPETKEYSGDKIKIGIAMDNAFHFYYQDNLDMLKSLGAELVFFSPVSDASLPQGISGIYFGGGYPENFAAELQANTGIKQDIRKACEEGMPVFAECGGFMYLAKAIIKDEKSWEMIGIFDTQIQMGKKLSSLGYYQGTTCTDSIIGPAGLSVSGHIFKWSQLTGEPENQPSLFKLKKNNQTMYDGYKIYNTIGSYLHIHFMGMPLPAQNFVNNCRVYKSKHENKL